MKTLDNLLHHITLFPLASKVIENKNSTIDYGATCILKYEPDVPIKKVRSKEEMTRVTIEDSDGRCIIKYDFNPFIKEALFRVPSTRDNKYFVYVNATYVHSSYMKTYEGLPGSASTMIINFRKSYIDDHIDSVTVEGISNGFFLTLQIDK